MNKTIFLGVALQHIAGIWKDVYLEALPQTRVSNVYIKPKVHEDKLEVVIRSSAGFFIQ
ncbi:MAG: hypothetical protein JWR09_1824 [Mucilaginibacter sp.]|nr:hypothetical protein [Mucilaginibacter sp.]